MAALCLFLLMISCQNEQTKEEKPAVSYRLGVLLAYDSPSSLKVFETMKSRLSDYEQKTKESLEIKLKEAHGDVSLLPDQARTVASQVDLIVAISTPALQAAMIETENIPIVFHQ